MLRPYIFPFLGFSLFSRREGGEAGSRAGVMRANAAAKVNPTS
jgi:hypothetical protein